MMKRETADELFGADRLVSYISAASGDLERALELHVWNSLLASAYWRQIECVEIFMRQRIAAALFENGLVNREKLTSITTGLFALESENRHYSQMTFGFWTYLLSPQNANKIWTPTLHKSFQPGVSRKALHRNASELQRLRNRVGHHEAVWHLNHEDLRDKILQVLRCISDEAIEWVASTTNLQAVLAERPT